MATWKKTNEAYFGDSFNRPFTVACYAANGEHLFDGKISTCDLSYSPDSLTTANIDCSLDTCGAVAKGLSGVAYGKVDYEPMKFCVDDLALNTSVSSLLNKLDELQAQIDNLKRKKTATSELRRALHTLNYKSEVERL